MASRQLGTSNGGMWSRSLMMQQAPHWLRQRQLNHADRWHHDPFGTEGGGDEAPDFVARRGARSTARDEPLYEPDSPAWYVPIVPERRGLVGKLARLARRLGLRR